MSRLVGFSQLVLLDVHARRQDTKKREAPKAASKKKDAAGGISMQRQLCAQHVSVSVEAWCEFYCRPVAKDTGKQTGSQRKPWVSRLGRDLQRFVEVTSVFFQFMENLS